MYPSLVDFANKGSISFFYKKRIKKKKKKKKMHLVGYVYGFDNYVNL